eukprot:GEMP01049492.1.p1 GENE.GEMP01049492.1~~GEMP01049492.1.p1  ORF type:complete len:225 (-),score=22.23 GEMP01049492.1:975-1649(-)
MAWRASSHLNKFLDSADFGHDKRNTTTSMTRSLHMQTCLSESPQREPFFPRFQRCPNHFERQKLLAQRKERETMLYRTILGSHSQSFPNLRATSSESIRSHDTRAHSVEGDDSEYPCPFARTSAAKVALMKLSYSKPLPMSTTLHRSPTNASRGKLHSTLKSWRTAFSEGTQLDHPNVSKVSGAANLCSGDLSNFYLTLRAPPAMRSSGAGSKNAYAVWPSLRV